MVNFKRLLTLAATVMAAGSACGGDVGGPAIGPTELELLAPSEATATVGDTVKAAVRVLNGSGHPVSDVRVNWRVAGGGTVSAAHTLSSADGRASVEWVLGTRAGDQALEAEVQGLEPLSITVTANGAAPVALALSPPGLVVDALADTVQLTVVGHDTYGNTVNVSALEWSSSAPAIVEALSDGKIVSKSNGEARVTVASDTLSASTDITVEQVAASVSIVGRDTVSYGLPAVFIAKVLDANGVPLNSEPVVTWSSPDEDRVRVDSLGTVTGKRLGAATLQVTTSAGLTATRSLWVQPAPKDAISGGTHSCALDADGQPWCWGPTQSRYGSGGESTPQRVNTDHRFIQIATGLTHTCGLTDTAEAYCWGTNYEGQLGTVGNLSRSVPTLVEGDHRFQLIELGDRMTCGIDLDGILLCWGLDPARAAGDGPADRDDTPQVVKAPGLFTELAVGDAHACAIDREGSMFCWGDNSHGQFGNGTTSEDPQLPVESASGMNFVDLEAGAGHTCGVREDGELLCWGDNRRGQLGDGTLIQRSAPGPVEGRFAYLDANGSTTCGVTSDHITRCWGQGAVASGPFTITASPTSFSFPEEAEVMVAGERHACGLAASGALYCAGSNYRGQLGGGDPFLSTSPVHATTLGSLEELVPTQGTTSCGRADGSFYCWGIAAADDPEEWKEVLSGADQFSGMNSVTTMSLGYRHACATAETGDAYCWGDNDHGQIGDGTTSFRASPELVQVNAGLTKVATARDHTCAISDVGQAYCWGSNDNGQLGTGSTWGGSPSPSAVVDTFAFSTLAAGTEHTCGLTQTGAAYCWGMGARTGTEMPSGDYGWAEDYGSPQPVYGNRTYTDLVARAQGTCGLTAARATWCWGVYTFDNGFSAGGGSRLPEQVTGDHIFTSLHAGNRLVCGIEADGTAYCWGWNDSGQIGNGSVATHPELDPVLAGGGEKFIDLAPADDHTCGITTTGDTLCWGAIGFGALGDGRSVWQPAPQLVVGVRGPGTWE